MPRPALEVRITRDHYEPAHRYSSVFLMTTGALSAAEAGSLVSHNLPNSAANANLAESTSLRAKVTSNWPVGSSVFACSCEFEVEFEALAWERCTLVTRTLWNTSWDVAALEESPPDPAGKRTTIP